MISCSLITAGSHIPWDRITDIGDWVVVLFGLLLACLSSDCARCLAVGLSAVGEPNGIFSSGFAWKLCCLISSRAASSPRFPTWLANSDATSMHTPPMLGRSGGNTLTPPAASAVTNSLRQATRSLPAPVSSPFCIGLYQCVVRLKYSKVITGRGLVYLLVPSMY